MRKRSIRPWLGQLAALALMVAATAVATEAQAQSGSLNIVQAQAQSGALINLDLTIPSTQTFMASVRISRTADFSLAARIGEIAVPVEDQRAVGYGNVLSLQVDTLNYAPGTYYFYTFPYSSNQAVYDTIQILPRSTTVPSSIAADTVARNVVMDLYRESGARVLPGQSVAPNEVLALATNLNKVGSFNNAVSVDFTGPASKTDLLTISVLRQFPTWQTNLAGVGSPCSGSTPINTSTLISGVSVVLFRAPAHQKYYEYDGNLTFTFSANAPASQGCGAAAVSLATTFNDTAATAAIPTFVDYNAVKYPGQTYRNDYPFDTFDVRIVRVSTVGQSMTGAADQHALAAQLQSSFQSATKGYFKLQVSGTTNVDYMSTPMFNAASSWYASVPKTPGQPVLNVYNADERLIMMWLYFEYGMGETSFVSWMQSQYAPRANGEDMTLYVYDGPGALGTAMGAGAARIKKQRVYNYACSNPSAGVSNVFAQTGASGVTTFHNAIATCANHTTSVAAYKQLVAQEFTQANVISTSIHEMGHTLWLDRIGFSTGDQSEKYFPFRNDTVYVDASLGFFTRYEYMSYGRDRSSLTGMSYGDDLLEDVLARYAQPIVSYSVLSHAAPGGVVNAKLGQPVQMRLTCNAPSGTAYLWYWYDSGPAPHGVGYGWSDGSSDVVTTFTPIAPGTHTYGVRCRDKLEPIAWQEHQSAIEYLTVNVDSGIAAGKTFGSYVVHSVTRTGAPAGNYTFHVTSPTAGLVALKRNGVQVSTLNYVWTTTVSASNPAQYYTFNFPGYFSITVRKAGTGTMNLYGMNLSIFNGTETLWMP